MSKVQLTLRHKKGNEETGERGIGLTAVSPHAHFAIAHGRAMNKNKNGGDKMEVNDSS